MIIIGAKGFAKEVLEVVAQSGLPEELFFFDNVSTDVPDLLYNQFKVLRSITEAEVTFKSKTDKRFLLGIGDPAARYKLSAKFESIGGELTTLVSVKASIGRFGTIIGKGSTIMTGVILTNDITVGNGCLINLNCTIGHDTRIGDFTEISPGVNISGNCTIGDYCNIGTNAVILPKVSIGKNVIVGAGAVVTKNVPDNSLVIGIPATVHKTLPEFNTKLA